MKNTEYIVVWVLVFIVAALVVYFSLPWTLLLGHGIVNGIVDSIQSIGQEKPSPRIVYGEFPLELVYEIDGEIVEVSDVYICEYRGYDKESGKIYWKGYMKSTGEAGFVLIKKPFQKVYCKIKSPSYYMGEQQYDDKIQPTVIWESIFYGAKWIDDAELYEKYGIRIISCKAATPIENSFEAFSNINK